MVAVSHQLMIVTGMSGAGRSTCLKILEDLGFEAVDNLPLPLMRRLLGSDEALEGDLAIGIDTRTRAFDPLELQKFVSELQASRNFQTRLVFCDCSDEVIQRRYSETRRRHPMAGDRAVADGIALERALLATIRDRADELVDTTDTTAAMLRQRLASRFARSGQRQLAITVMSFAFRHGLPREADLVFDMRFLRNPHYVAELKHATGLDQPVQAYIMDDDAYAPFIDRWRALVTPLLPHYSRDGKSYLTIAFGCTGGQHRSVFIAERASSTLRDAGWTSITVHREIEMGRIALVTSANAGDQARSDDGR